MIRRSGKQPEGWSSADGLDETVWEKMSRILAAAHKGDRTAFVSASEQLTQSMPLEKHRLAGAYVLYLLQYRVIDMLGRKPTQMDLHDVAVRHSVKFSAPLTAVPDGVLEDTLRTTFKLASPDREVKGGAVCCQFLRCIGHTSR
jgi:hypothetical protein